MEGFVHSQRQLELVSKTLRSLSTYQPDRSLFAEEMELPSIAINARRRQMV